MPYNPSSTTGITRIERIKPFDASWVGDSGAGGSNNAQTYMNARRDYLGKVADITARNALTPADGNWVEILDDGTGAPAFHIYRSATGWGVIGGQGSVSVYKTPARAATTAALATNTRSGNVLTASASGTLAAIDGVTLVVNDRVLVKDEALGANNGIYTVTSLGSGGTPWVLTRATDVDSSAEVLAGLQVPVTEGASNAASMFTLATANPITLNTTALSFVAKGGGGAMTTPQLVNADGGTGNATYTLLTDGSYEMVWKSGAIQVQGADYTRSGQKITFVTGNIPVSGLDYVVVSSSISSTGNSAGGGAMSSPAVITADVGTGNATYSIPGSGLNEFVWKGGAIQFLGLDYTKTGNKITFVSGNIPTGAEPVAISSSITPMSNTDAVTFAGHAFSEFVLKTMSGGLQVVADTTAAAALTGLANDAMVLVKSLGLFRTDTAATEAADGETILTITAGGRLYMELAHPDYVAAYVDPLIEDARPNTALVTVAAQSLAAGGSYSQIVSLPGARANDLGFVGAPTDLPVAIFPKAVVTSPDSITLTMFNPSGSTVVVPANTWRVGVLNS